MSDRAIAEEVGVGNDMVSRYRQVSQKDTSPLADPTHKAVNTPTDKRLGRDGKSYPTTKPAPAKVAPVEAEPAADWTTEIQRRRDTTTNAPAPTRADRSPNRPRDRRARALTHHQRSPFPRAARRVPMLVVRCRSRALSVSFLSNRSTTMSKSKRFKLRLKSISYLSAVDLPAQPLATAAIIKRDTGDEVTATVRVAKISDDEVGVVMGWAFVCEDRGEPHYDLQGDAIDESNLVKIAAEYMSSGGLSDEQHDSEASGTTAFIFPLTREIQDALAIKSDRTGLIVGVRPAPEVLAKFRDGTYTGFSLAGIGERSPVEKAAPATPVLSPLEKDARIRELEQQIREAEQHATQKLRDHQVAKARASTELARNRDAENTAWVTGIAKERGIVEAREVAGYNVAKAGAAPTWADRWLAANPAPAEVAKRAPESDAQVFKRRTTALEQASRAYESGRETFAKRVNKAAAAVTGDYLATPEGAAVYAAYNKAQAALTEGEPGEAERALTAEIDGLTAEIEALTEQFSISHNLEPMAARERLMVVSPTFAAKFKRMYVAATERSTMIANRKAGAARIYSSGEELLAAAAEAQAAQARKAMLPLAERKLVEHVETIAKARGLDRAAATVWALEHDQTAIALYQIAAAEQATGRPLPDQVAKALSGAR